MRLSVEIKKGKLFEIKQEYNYAVKKEIYRVMTKRATLVAEHVWH
jgi:hypothetical protein